MQDGVPETIESLRKAGMQVWVITGDKQETAVNIGYACNLIAPEDEVIYLNTDSVVSQFFRFLKNCLLIKKIISQEQMSALLRINNDELERTRGRLEAPPDPESSFLSLNTIIRQFNPDRNSALLDHSGSHPPLSKCC